MPGCLETVVLSDLVYLEFAVYSNVFPFNKALVINSSAKQISRTPPRQRCQEDQLE